MSATPVDAEVHRQTAETETVVGDSGDVFARLDRAIADASVQPGRGIAASFADEVPAGVRKVVDEIMTQFDSLLALPEGSVQIAVGWSDIPSLGLGGPVVVERQGTSYPAALADTLYGGQHAQGPVDGYVSMGSGHAWHFGSADTLPSDRFDFRSAFSHELIHALGFAVDTATDELGRVHLSGRTAQFDRLLYSGGRPLVNLTRAQQSQAFGTDDVWVDVGGGRLYPLNSNGGRGLSHFGNAHSAVDSSPGALMYAGLVNGQSHHIDGPVLGVLSQLGYTPVDGPQPPTGLRIDGRNLAWHIDLTQPAAPPVAIHVTPVYGGVRGATAVLPGAVHRHVLDSRQRLSYVEVVSVSSDGRTAPTVLTVDSLLMADAKTIDELTQSADYLPAYGDVLRLYWAFFNREPDVDGARYWISLFRAGLPLDRIAVAFSGSGEFVARYGNLDTERYLEVIYLNVLGRPRDNDGFRYWLDLLTSGRLSRGEVVRWIALAPEFVNAHPY